MKSREIRQKFIEFFTRNGHRHLPSSPLIPADDPTLLFANAGMNQFKNIFLGNETRDYKRAVTIQKCMRAGGKHNDLDNVGRTSRHLTFFEMLGNFSFGDYFKKEAIAFAWEFLTKELGINPEKLFVTVYEEDQEAYDIWHKELGLHPDKITRLGRKDNFWQMGDTGPCGPCSEIYVDKGAKNDFEKTCKPGDECERFMEIWNLVFMQFNRHEDGTEEPLQKTGVDTGMGLERLVSFLQGVESAFDCDVFGPILKSIGRHSGISYERATPEQKVAFRVLADHIRSTCLAIADGGMPSNEGRGYVIRKIIRRAALFAQKLGSSTLFADLAKDFIGSFGEIYPELIANKTLIEKTVKDEVQKFEQNLTQGVAIFKTYLANATKDKIISGEQAFKLYDTYGFPLELTCLLAEDEDFTVDISGFEAAMEQQRLQSGKKTTTTQSIAPANLPETKFVGYDSYSTNSKIIFISNGREPVKELAAGEEGYIVTDQTPFYVEGGGQVSDFGTLEYQGTIMPVQAVKREHGTSIVHKVQAAKNLAIGATVTLHIDKERRAAIQRNHTATHLLQSALMNVLGAHVKQAGSYVSSDVARFDFTHHSAPTAEVLKEVEHLVNAAIMRAIPVTCNVTSYQDAISKGVIAFFGDKYNPDAVRVVQVPGVSAELCGGTHVKNTGEIGCFKITESSALSSGIRRITAVTGFGALETFDQALSIVHTATNLFKAKPEDLPTLLAEKQERLLALEKELQKKEKELLLAQLLSSSNRTSGSTALHMIVTTEGNPKDFRDILKDASKKINGTLVILASTEKGTAFALQINTNTLTPEMIIKNLAEQFGLKGRAQGNFIQGGGSAVDIKLLENKITSWFAA